MTVVNRGWIDYVSNTTTNQPHSSKKQKMTPGKQSILFSTTKTWDGEPAADSEKMEIRFSVKDLELEVEVQGPLHGDPAPAAPAGELDGLWCYEVAELFLLGADGHYLEIELGPHGHYLILDLSGVRQVKRSLSPIRYVTNITGSRWKGVLTLALDQSILPFSHANAYAIHGLGVKRRYLAAVPVPGNKPDFHQPRYFASLDEC